MLIKNGTIESGMYVIVEDAISPVRISSPFLLARSSPAS